MAERKIGIFRALDGDRLRVGINCVLKEWQIMRIFSASEEDFFGVAEGGGGKTRYL